MYWHFNKQNCKVSKFRWYPCIFSTDPASVVSQLWLWPWWHLHLKMLHYKYSEYSPFNTRLLPVTHGKSIVKLIIACIWLLKCTKNFQLLRRFQPQTKGRWNSATNWITKNITNFAIKITLSKGDSPIIQLPYRVGRTWFTVSIQ